MSETNLHFIISAPRSGSTWLASALNFHPQLFATEQRLLGQFCEVWRNNDGTTAPRITFDSFARAFGMHYFYQPCGMNFDQFVETFQVEFARFLVEFGQRHAGKPIIIDKITPYPGTASLVVQQIRKLFPQSKMIRLVRDGRDVLTSGAFDWLLKDAHGTPRYQFFVERQPGMRLKRFFDEAVIERWARNWLETVEALPNPIAEIRYENMKQNLPSELVKLFRLLGVNDELSIAEECARQTAFRKMAGREAGQEDPTAKARKGVVGDWQNYFTQRDGEQFVALAGKGLLDMGYEPNHDWVGRLPQELNLVLD